MRGAFWAGAILALVGLAGPASAAPSAPPPTADASDAAPPEGLDLTIRARSLGVTPSAGQDAAGRLGLEPMKAPTGAGTSRMPPPVTEVAPGVFLHVAPACVPGEDPLSPRRITPRRRR